MGLPATMPHRSLLCWPIVGCIFYICGSLALRRHRYSVFYSISEHEYAIKSSQRLTNAVDYFHSKPSAAAAAAAAATADSKLYPRLRLPPVDLQTQTPAELCFAVVTTTRPERYFLQTMHALLTGLAEVTDPSTIRIIVVDASSSLSKDVQLVAPYVDTTVHAAVAPHPNPNPNQQQLQSNWLRSETLTYISALEECAKSNSNYTIVVEDDAVATRTFYSQLQQMLRNIKSKTQVGSIKLFQTEYFFGWENKDVFLFLCIFLACSVGSGSLLYGLLVGSFSFSGDGCARNTHTKERKLKEELKRKEMQKRHFVWHMEMNSVWCIVVPHACCFGIFVVVALLAVGKQHVLPPFQEQGTFHFRQSTTIDSNTVATLFHTERTTSLVDFLRSGNGSGSTTETTPRPVDVLVNQWCLAQHLDRYYHVPSLFQHVGYWSSSAWKRQRTQHRLRRQWASVFKQSSTFV